MLLKTTILNVYQQSQISSVSVRKRVNPKDNIRAADYLSFFFQFLLKKVMLFDLHY